MSAVERTCLAAVHIATAMRRSTDHGLTPRKNENTPAPSKPNVDDAGRRCLPPGQPQDSPVAEPILPQRAPAAQAAARLGYQTEALRAGNVKGGGRLGQRRVDQIVGLHLEQPRR